MTTTDRRRRSVTLASAAVWGVCALALLAVLTYDAVAGAAQCELGPGSSVLGTGRWQWLTPGTVCTYQLPRGVGTLGFSTYPSPARTVVAVLLVAWPASVLWLRSGRAAVSGP